MMTNEQTRQVVREAAWQAILKRLGATDEQPTGIMICRDDLDAAIAAMHAAAPGPDPYTYWSNGKPNPPAAHSPEPSEAEIDAAANEIGTDFFPMGVARSLARAALIAARNAGPSS